ncbi:L,D-transpeptidase family protein [Streptomyces sp. GC420]|uniref:L,D-transpeptidase family protein n=1 Tax=Streptomyces sp. GC420 TaxID=2697568 RepID=UPI001414ED6B|nr:L,D-transpeptidase family protein [Streptomyces sp. GC420]NBM14577.1 L,D-transpeptidase family protein [Streptomyces sp. GC420]
MTAAALALASVLAGCGGHANAPAEAQDAPVTRAAAPGTTQAVPPPAGEPPATAVPARLPGLGPRTLAHIPEGTRQVLLVTGRGKDSPESRAVLYRRTSAGWEPGATWPAHNGFRGWTDDHHLNDLRSPVGVFTLTDAGGLLADPGTKLPYDRSGGFTIGGTGFEGEPLAGSFDYVVAIDYNRRTGTSPLDWTRPLGAGKGGGIWLHVDHGGPTRGCVSLRRTHMKELLRALDPGLRPVVVMGDAGSLAH